MLPSRLKILRKELHLTQKDLAAQLNITREAYSHYESGSRQLPVDILRDLAVIHHVSTDYILCLSDSREQDMELSEEDVRLVAQFQQLDTRGKRSAATFIDVELASLKEQEKISGRGPSPVK